MGEHLLAKKRAAGGDLQAKCSSLSSDAVQGSTKHSSHKPAFPAKLPPARRCLLAVPITFSLPITAFALLSTLVLRRKVSLLLIHAVDILGAVSYRPLQWLLLLYFLCPLIEAQVTHLSVARVSLAAASAGNKMVFAGGRYVRHFVSRRCSLIMSRALSGHVVTVDIYDVSTSQWNSTSTGAGQLSVARSDLAAAAAGSKIIFAGGLYESFSLALTFLMLAVIILSAEIIPTYS